MPKLPQSEFRTKIECNDIREKKNDDSAIARRWRVRTIIVCVMGAVAILSTMLTAHVTNETAQDVAIGETRVEVREIKKHVERLDKMDEKLDIIIKEQRKRP